RDPAVPGHGGARAGGPAVAAAAVAAAAAAVPGAAAARAAVGPGFGVRRCGAGADARGPGVRRGAGTPRFRLRAARLRPRCRDAHTSGVTGATGARPFCSVRTAIISTPPSTIAPPI